MSRAISAKLPTRCSAATSRLSIAKTVSPTTGRDQPASLGHCSRSDPDASIGHFRRRRIEDDPEDDSSQTGAADAPTNPIASPTRVVVGFRAIVVLADGDEAPTLGARRLSPPTYNESRTQRGPRKARSTDQVARDSLSGARRMDLREIYLSLWASRHPKSLSAARP